MNEDGGGGRGHITQGFEIQVKEFGFYPKHNEKALDDFFFFLRFFFFN